MSSGSPDNIHCLVADLDEMFNNDVRRSGSDNGDLKPAALNDVRNCGSGSMNGVMWTTGDPDMDVEDTGNGWIEKPMAGDSLRNRKQVDKNTDIKTASEQNSAVGSGLKHVGKNQSI